MRRIIPLPFPADRTISSPAQLGAVLRAARTQAAMSLEDLALTLGIAKQTLQDLERGTGTVSLSIAFAALAGLGIKLTRTRSAGEVDHGA
jgi:transcriptional regulator with XRE-family HTH domain